MEASPMTAIATRCIECTHAFKQIRDILQQAPAERCIVSDSLVQDELGRFRVWLGNVGRLFQIRLYLIASALLFPEPWDLFGEWLA